MENATVSVSAHIIGKVQGVGFRAWTRRVATDLNLTGWVANDSDGSVRAIFTGSTEAVDAMLERIGVGPAAARVERVITEPADPDDTTYDFQILG